MNTIIEQIKGEIKGWLREYAEDSQFELGERYGYKRLLSFLSTIESEKSTASNDNLNFALNKYIGNLDEELQREGCTYEFDWDDITETIREAGTHFAQWGAEHLKK